MRLLVRRGGRFGLDRRGLEAEDRAGILLDGDGGLGRGILLDGDGFGRGILLDGDDGLGRGILLERGLRLDGVDR